MTTTVLTGTMQGGQVVWRDGVPPDGTTVQARADATATPPPDEADQPTLVGLLAIAGKAADLPADFPAQHDHYLRGTPER